MQEGFVGACHDGDIEILRQGDVLQLRIGGIDGLPLLELKVAEGASHHLGGLNGRRHIQLQLEAVELVREVQRLHIVGGASSVLVDRERAGDIAHAYAPLAVRVDGINLCAEHVAADLLGQPRVNALPHDLVEDGTRLLLLHDNAINHLAVHVKRVARDGRTCWQREVQLALQDTSVGVVQRHRHLGLREDTIHIRLYLHIRHLHGLDVVDDRQLDDNRRQRRERRKRGTRRPRDDGVLRRRKRANEAKQC